jgi:hypothetical protein
VGKHLLFSFLSTSPNAMPVLLTTLAECEQWLEAPAEEALQLHKPAPNDAVVVLPPRQKVA